MPSSCRLTTLKHHSNILYRIHIYMQNSENNKNHERHNITTICLQIYIPTSNESSSRRESIFAGLDRSHCTNTSDNS